MNGTLGHFFYEKHLSGKCGVDCVMLFMGAAEMLAAMWRKLLLWGGKQNSINVVNVWKSQARDVELACEQTNVQLIVVNCQSKFWSATLFPTWDLCMLHTRKEPPMECSMASQMMCWELAAELNPVPLPPNPDNPYVCPLFPINPSNYPLINRSWMLNIRTYYKYYKTDYLNGLCYFKLNHVLRFWVCLFCCFGIYW